MSLLTKYYSNGLVVCFMGTLGAGKSYHMSLEAFRLSRLLNLQIFANYTTYFTKSRRIMGVRDLMTIEDGVLCLDEMQAILDSRAFSTNVDTTQWLLLIRKMGLGCLYTTQHFSYVDTRLRQITDLLITHEKLAVKGYSKIAYWKVSGMSMKKMASFVLKHSSVAYGLYDHKDKQVALTIDGYALPYNVEKLGLSDAVSQPARVAPRPAAADIKGGAHPPIAGGSNIKIVGRK